MTLHETLVTFEPICHSPHPKSQNPEDIHIPAERTEIYDGVGTEVTQANSERLCLQHAVRILLGVEMLLNVHKCFHVEAETKEGDVSASQDTTKENKHNSQGVA